MVPDFRNVKDEKDIQARFIASAREIMCGYQLEYGQNAWDVTSLELYLRLDGEPTLWSDLSTDEDNEQLNRETWYVSKKRGPGFWRIDITAGDREQNIHAGLLIRQINRTSGPSMALHTIVRGHYDRRKWPDDEVERLNKDIHGASIFAGKLKLAPRQVRLKSDLWIGPRIGINKKHLHWDADLRVATWKDRGLKEYQD
jgi:hypothetical protein